MHPEHTLQRQATTCRHKGWHSYRHCVLTKRVYSPYKLAALHADSQHVLT